MCACVSLFRGVCAIQKVILLCEHTIAIDKMIQIEK